MEGEDEEDISSPFLIQVISTDELSELKPTQTSNADSPALMVIFSDIIAISIASPAQEKGKCDFK